MNPIGIDVRRFLIAEDSEAPGRVKGFGQLAPLGASGAMELRSLVVEPDSRSAHGCSVSARSGEIVGHVFRQQGRLLASEELRVLLDSLLRATTESEHTWNIPRSGF